MGRVGSVSHRALTLRKRHLLQLHMYASVSDCQSGDQDNEEHVSASTHEILLGADDIAVDQISDQNGTVKSAPDGVQG